MAGTFTLKAYKKTISVLNTAERLAPSTVTTAALGRYAQGALIHCPSGNSATVYIGGSDVNSSTSGFPIAAGATVSMGDLQRGDHALEFDMREVYVYGAANDVVFVLQEKEIAS